MSYDTTPAGRDALVVPALSLDDWREALASPEAAVRLLRRHLAAAAASAEPERAAEHARAAAALANHLLPDGHPRKVTRPAVESLRAAVAVYRDAVGATFGPLTAARRFPWRAAAGGAEVLGELLPPDEAR